MITPEDVYVELGRDTPDVDSIPYKQMTARIERAYRAIQRRAESLGVNVAGLDTDDVDEVVLYAVARMSRRPADGAEQVSEQVGVDDGSASETRRYPGNGYGGVFILDEWWDILGLREQVATGWSGSVPYARSW